MPLGRADSLDNKQATRPPLDGKGALPCLVVAIAASAHGSDAVLSSYFFLRLP